MRRENIDHLTVLILGTSQISPLTVDGDEDFVRIPSCRRDALDAYGL